jgi:hypothetical protein
MSVQSLVMTFVAGFPLNLTQPFGIILVEKVLANCRECFVCGEKNFYLKVYSRLCPFIYRFNTSLMRRDSEVPKIGWGRKSLVSYGKNQENES